MSRAAGAARDVAQALLNLGMIAYFNDETDLAIERLEESAAVAREAVYEPQLSLVLTFLARARLRGRGPHDQRGLAALKESLRLSQARAISIHHRPRIVDAWRLRLASGGWPSRA